MKKEKSLAVQARLWLSTGPLLRGKGASGKNDFVHRAPVVETMKFLSFACSFLAHRFLGAELFTFYPHS